MKTIRFIAGILLILNGILHFVEYANASDNPGSMGVLVFGLIYLVVGSLLLNKKHYPLYLGIFVPIIGMTLSIIKLGPPELISLLSLFKVVDVIVVVLCIYVLISERRIKAVV